ncbi:hypothetical protein [Nocardia carnea]|uniref:Uncharacterized protein n=1 Tax=Nocardia carnea TaxID=37328 RepID=A0ABW7TX37_9NOCA|nr:hypothetical protein [Nocardia carnea]
MADPGDLDPLEVARTQLHAALTAAETQPLTLEAHLQLGLLAAQIALAERLPIRASGTQEVPGFDEEFTWSAGRVEQFLGNLDPPGIQLLEILVAEGGAATPERIKELTGRKSLAGITSALRAAAHRTTPELLPPPRLIQVVRVRGTDKAQLYRISAEMLPIIAAALQRIGSSSVTETATHL